MKDLTSDLDDKVLKGLQHKIDEAKVETDTAKEQLVKKEEELARLAKERDELNSKYEAKVAEFAQLKKEADEVKSLLSSKEGEIDTFKAQVEDLNKKNEEITNSLSEKDSKIKELNDALAEKDKIVDAQNVKIEESEKELTSLKPEAPTSYSSEERLTCPSCGAVGKDLKSEEDKTKVLSYIGHKPLYAKKNICKKCGYEF